MSVVVEDVSHAIDFFTALGMTLEDRAPVERPVMDHLCGLGRIKADIAMMLTPDGHGRVELTNYHSPPLVAVEPAVAPPNTLGLRQVMFAVDDVDATVERVRPLGAALVGEVVQYGDQYRLAYLRGPAGIIVALAEELG